MPSDTIRDESALISSIREGDAKAFDVVFKHYSDKIYRFSFGFLKSKEDAEEIVQEVFIKLWDNRSTLRLDTQFSSFLFTIAHHGILNQIRKNKNGIKAMTVKRAGQPVHNVHVEEELISSEYEQQAQAAISSLPPQRKKIFQLSRESHLSYSEIASELKISPKTVEVHISQALKDIRRHLVKVGITLSIVIFFRLFF